MHPPTTTLHEDRGIPCTIFHTQAANCQQSEKENFQLFASQHCIFSNDLGVFTFWTLGV